MAEQPVFALPAPATEVTAAGCILRDESATKKWRMWADGFGVSPGRARRTEETIVLAVAPGEWIALGGSAPDDEAVELTHVRAMFRLTGDGAAAVLAHLCPLDLGDLMTPDGAAARTLVAGVATELVRDDVDGRPSYVLLMSRSFARAVWERLVHTAAELEAG